MAFRAPLMASVAVVMDAGSILEQRCCSSSVSSSAPKDFTRLSLAGKGSLFWGRTGSGDGMLIAASRDSYSDHHRAKWRGCYASVGHSDALGNGDEQSMETGLALHRLAEFRSETGTFQQKGLILHKSSKRSGEGGTSAMISLERMSKEQAMSLTAQATQGTGWTTGSGLQGPSMEMTSFLSVRRGSSNEEEAAAEETKEQMAAVMPSWPLLTRSPRRRMRVEFTCNKCGERTLRAINPDAYKTGTVFVQCGGCMVFHKLVDNLNLFHEFQGPIFEGVDKPGFATHHSYDFLGLEDM